MSVIRQSVGRAGANSSGVQVVTTERLAPFLDDWDRLARRATRPTHSVMSWWLEAAGAVEPLFVLVVDDDGLLGGFPFQVERWRGLPRFRALGYDMWPSDIDVVAEPSRYDAVVAAIGDWFRSRSDYLIELRGLTSTTRLHSHIATGAEVRPIAPTWTAPLGSDFSDYLGSLGRSFRKEVGRLRRKLTREGYRAHVASPDELPEALRTLEELHRLQFGKQSSFLPFFDRFSRAAVAGARSNQVFFHTLYDAENTPVAIDVWIRAGNRLLNYIGGRHPDGPSGAGTVLIAAAIEDAYSRGIQEISLGSGFGGWKERWAPHRNDQLHLTGAVGLRARSLVWARDTARTAARLVRKDRNRDE